MNQTPNPEISNIVLHKSRWGYHPCDLETCKKLKKISLAYQEGIKQQASWNRWNAKLPKNRVIREWKYGSCGRRNGSQIIGPAKEPQVNNLLRFMNANFKDFSSQDKNWMRRLIDATEEYRKARIPTASPDLIPSLKWDSKTIDALLSEASR